MIPGSAAVLASLLALLPGPAVDARCTTHAPRHADVPDRAGAPESSADPRPDDELRTLFRSGVPYGRFLDEARNRVDLWHANTDASAHIDADLVERARAVGGVWHVLAVAVDSCSDSVSTLPWLAALVDRVDGLELRIVDPRTGRSVMESHPTPDGRAATPTMLLLDGAFDEVGCFIERPPGLQRWLAERPGLSPREVYEGKMAWYAEDGGEDTVRAFVEMMEAAAEGERICR